jgi:hypothetical protein
MAEKEYSPDGSEDGRATDGDGADSATENSDPPLPAAVIERVETLTRRARRAVDENERDAYLEERATLLSTHEYEARIREDDAGETLVLYPAEWIEDGTIQVDRIDDTDRGIERPLSGVRSGADWADVDEHNREIAAAVRKRHGEVHGETAAAFADFMSNHYAKPIEDATEQELTEFLTDYFIRNAWPSDDQKAAVRESVRLVYVSADEPVPL